MGFGWVCQLVDIVVKHPVAPPGPGVSVRPLPLRSYAPTKPLPYSSAPMVAMGSPLLLKTATKPPLTIEPKETTISLRHLPRRCPAPPLNHTRRASLIVPVVALWSASPPPRTRGCRQYTKSPRRIKAAVVCVECSHYFRFGHVLILSWWMK